MTDIRMRCFVCVSVAIALLIAPATAQTSDILGTVTDPSGGVVPSSRVTVHQLETGEERQTATGPNGQYRFVGLAAGHYEIRFESPGLR